MIHYLANGAKSFPKERIELFADGGVVTIDNWRRVRSYGRGPRGSAGLRPDKGHLAEMVAWRNAVLEGGPAPIPIAEVMEVSRWSLVAAEQVKTRDV